MTDSQGTADYFDDGPIPMPLVGDAPWEPGGQPSALGSFARHAGRQALPTAGGIAAFPASAAPGAFAGTALGGPVGGAVLGAITGLAGSFGAGWLVEEGQSKLLTAFPGVARALGQDEATRRADELANPTASFLGDIAPQAAFMRPGRAGFRAMLAGGAIAGGVEAGSEYARTGSIEPWKVGAQTLVGTLLNRNTRLGDLLQAPANRLVSSIATSGGVTEARLAADDVTDAGAAAFHVDDAAVQARADAIAETHPNLSPTTRMAYARAELLADAAGAHRTPDERAAGTVIESDAQAEHSNPFTGPDAAQKHGERLAGAVDAMLHDEPAPDGGPAHAPAPAIAPDAWRAAVEHVESRGDPDAVSPKGALGRMQVMPATAANPGHGIRPAADHSDAELTRVGTELLAALERKYGNQVLATAAYNAGEGRVDRWLRTIGDPRNGTMSDADWAERIPIAETRDYVRKVYAAAGHELPRSPILRPELLAEPAAGEEEFGPRFNGDHWDANVSADRAEAEADMSIALGELAEQRFPDLGGEAQREAFRLGFRAALGDAEAARRAPETAAAKDGAAEAARYRDGLPEDQRAALDGYFGRAPIAPPEFADVVAWLRAHGEGEAPGALWHPEIGPIDLVWGKAGDPAKGFKGGFGLAHILAKHPEMAGEIEDLPGLIAGMDVTAIRGGDRVDLSSPDHAAGVALTLHGASKRWLVSAFRRGEAGQPPPGPHSRPGPDGGGADFPRRGGAEPIAETAAEVNAAALERAGEPKPETSSPAAEAIEHDLRMAIDSKARFTTSKGSTYVVHQDGTTTRDKAFRPEHGEAEQGPQPRSQKTFFVTPEDAVKLAEFQAQGGPKVAIARTSDGRWGVKYLEGKDAGKFERRTVVAGRDQPAEGLMPVELWKDGTRVHFGNEIVTVENSSDLTVQLDENSDAVPVRSVLESLDDEKRGIAALRACVAPGGLK